MTLLSASCTTSRIKAPERIPFPDPVVDGISVVTYDSGTDTVSMPLWYWIRLTEYAIDVDTAFDIAGYD